MTPSPNLTDRLKVVIFDCDGVMFDSREANIAFYNTVLAHFEKPLLTKEGVDIVHMSTAEGAINYLFRDDPRLPEAQQYRGKVGYQQFIPLMVMEPFLEETLKNLREQYHLALATNRTNTIHAILETFNLENYFDFVVSSLDVNHPKPHPEGILKILDHFSIDRREAVYVGDATVDQEAARQANVFFIAYKQPRLEADYSIDDLRELGSLLGKRQRYPGVI